MQKKNNIILYQFLENNNIIESIPQYLDESTNTKYLAMDASANLLWLDLDLSLNLIIDNRFKDTSVYYSDGRLGIGRFPLFNYRVDLAIPKDKRMTAFHIGDGSYGFSLGNGTNVGFIPEIIGVGSDENDAGLYFAGIAGSDTSSHVPLIIFDGRDYYGEKLTNRPIFGVTSANYHEYIMLLDNNGDLNLLGDIILENKSLKSIINSLLEDVSILKSR